MDGRGDLAEGKKEEERRAFDTESKPGAALWTVG
jgi:hypothetical protein